VILIEEVKEILKALLAGQETLIARIDAIDMRLSKAEGNIVKLGERLEAVANDVSEIKKGQERQQERILEMLSLKAIETDSYINKFKRRFP